MAGADKGRTPTHTVLGLHAVRHLLRGAPQTVRSLHLQSGRNDRRLQELVTLAEAAGVHIERVAREVLDRLVPGERHQGAIARVREVPGLSEGGLEAFVLAQGRDAFVLVLDGVQDPHNLGACLRSADAGGVDVVIAPKDRAAALTATVRKVACGAAESTPFVQVTNLARTLRMLGQCGVFLVGTSHGGASSLYDCDLTGPLGLVLGGEQKGLRRLTAEHCDVLACLPMLGQVESLNVSVAAGICVYEAARQRGLADLP